MNIGTQTSSVINHLYSRMTVDAPAPKVGMAATILSWSDRHAATVTEVSELCGARWLYEIRVVEDKVIVTSGSTHNGSATFAYSTNPAGVANIYRMNRKTRAWVKGYINQDTGKFKMGQGGLILGCRDHYVDPSF